MTYRIMTTHTDKTSLRIYPRLAEEIGLNESIVLLQLDYLQSISNSEIIDGRKWTYQSTRKLHSEYFPFWSVATIDRALKKAEEAGLIFVGNFNKHSYDKTRWFAINWDVVSQLKSILVADDETMKLYEPEPDDLSQNETPFYQNETSINQNDTRSYQNETTIPETTTETTTEKKIKEAVSPPATPQPDSIKENKNAAAYELGKEIAKITNIDYGIRSQTARIIKVAKDLMTSDTDPDLESFSRWWYRYDWRGKRGQPPTPEQIPQVWGAYKTALRRMEEQRAMDDPEVRRKLAMAQVLQGQVS